MNLVIGVFVLAFGACVYVYFLYPLLILALARLRPRVVRRARIHPSLSIIIPAFNEAAEIEEKVRGTLNNGYLPDRLEVIVASDGSFDDTVPLARRVADPRVRVLDFPRGGKVRALNYAVREASGEVLVFTDADVVLEHGALALLAESFADPQVGGVTGRKVQVPRADLAESSPQGEGLYVRYDEWQKELESTFGSAVASHGALHAVRRSLYKPLKDPTVADDMAISMQVVLQGYRLAYEPRARAQVEPSESDGVEIRRKVRVANQVMRALLNLGPSLLTARFYSVQLLSHKLLRYLVPFFLMVMFASNLWLAVYHAAIGWDILWVLQVTFYMTAFLRAASRYSGSEAFEGFTVPYYFVLVNTAALLAVLSFLRGQRESVWTPRGGFDSNPTGP